MTVDHLTQIPNVPSRADAVPGMAHFRGSGPGGTECNSCFYYTKPAGSLTRTRLQASIGTFAGYRAKQCGFCLKYQQLMGERGPKIRGNSASCRYYAEAAR
jgi:hypothetical protein